MIIKYAIIVFITQLVFIFCRTWNVRCIGKGDLQGALVSGAFVHISWLVSIAIGSVSMNELLNDWQWPYLVIVLCSLSGGLIGTYLGFKEKNKK